ncbi:MFS transporter [Symbioplanes lichenis]|uniref:MFS transporter n=1 Tax=Symbioplanes lichenis TaxID=1629072 RepID=UPI00273A20B1|nr:MFS transporter [Actinoplanes lichenis]
MGSYRWVVLAVATVTQASAAFFVQGLGALGVLLQRELGLSAAQLGLLMSAAQLVPLAGLLVAGELLDRYGERWVVGAGAGLVGAALLTGTLAPGYAALLVVLLLAGAGYSTVQPGGSKSVAAWFDSSRRGVAMGVRQAGLPLGAALASASLPAVGAAFGWRATLGAGGVVALAGAVLFAATYRPPPASDRKTGTADDRKSGSRRSLLWNTALACGVALIAVQCGIGLLTVLHLHDKAGLSPARAALVLVAAQGAGVAGRILLAALSDRRRTRNRQSVVTVSMLAVLGALILLMTPAGWSPIVATAAFVWLGFFGIGWYGPWVALVTEAAPPGRTGFALGLAMAVNQVAIVLVPPVLGLLRDTSGGFVAPWGLLAALIAAALVTQMARTTGGGVPRSRSRTRTTSLDPRPGGR